MTDGSFSPGIFGEALAIPGLSSTSEFISTAKAIFAGGSVVGCFAEEAQEEVAA